MDRNTCAYIVANTEGAEAAMLLSNGSLQAFYCRKELPMDEIASISSGLIAIAQELHLFDTAATAASMFFETKFGALNIRAVTPDTQLVICLRNGYVVPTIDRIVKRIVDEIVEI